MHVCHINLAGGFRGGERQTELLIRGLSELGLTQTLVAREDTALGERVSDVERLAVKRIRKPFIARWRHVEGDIVHAHENKGAHLAQVVERLRKRPFIITRRIALRPSDGYFTRDMYKRADAVVAVAGAIAETISRYEATARTQVIYSVTAQLRGDARAVRALRERWKRKFVVLNVAALSTYQKGQQYLVEAARILSRRHDNLQFVVCGGGPDEAALRRSSADLPNFSFEGHVENVGDYFAAADLFVLPSLWEGLGTSTLDAMNAGLPCVVSAVDGLPEIVRHEETGLLVPPSDAAALAAAIERLVVDVAERRRLAEAGCAFSRRFTPESMTSSYHDLYQRLLSGRCA